MYQRSISTLGCGDLTGAQAVALARRFGLERVEWRALAGSLDLPAALAREYGDPAGFAGVREAVVLGSSCHLTDAAPERAALLALAPWAEAAGVRWLRVFDGGAGLDEAAALARGRDFLAWWRAERARRGWRVDLAVETHDRLLTAAAVRRWHEALGGFAVLWDAHHTWRRGGEDPLATWAALRDLVVHVHVKDSVRDDTPAGFHYVLPGDGEFPMPALRAALAREFAGAVSLEWERWWHPALPPLEDALAVALVRRWW